MNLSFQTQGVSLSNNSDMPVANVTDEISRVTKGSIFVCISGSHFNSHTLASQALEAGAMAIVGEEELNLPSYYRVPDARLALAQLTSAFFSNPSKQLKVIGITGTNGKTTTALYIKYLLEALGHSCGYIGTLGIFVPGEADQITEYTTPTPELLYKSLRDMVKHSVEYCVMEVSSQALSQKRADAIRFHTGIFTNLSPEHTDYHGSVKNYLQAKCRLAALSEHIIVNTDDAYAKDFLAAYPDKSVTLYSARGAYSEYMAKNIRYSAGNTEILLLHSLKLCRVTIPVIGEFSVYNTLAAVAAVTETGEEFYSVAGLCKDLPQIPGRAQIAQYNGIRVCIDYAHTPSALSEILLALTKESSGSTITVFGCGGNRDKEKRPLMGKIAANMSQSVILTSDNSRNEEIGTIIEDIRKGIKSKSSVFIIPDRAQAIRFALSKAAPGDTVLIAGKGHETTQCQNNEAVYFSDEQQVKLYFGQI